MKCCKTKICFYKIVLVALMIRDGRKVTRDTRRPVKMGGDREEGGGGGKGRKGEGGGEREEEEEEE